MLLYWQRTVVVLLQSHYFICPSIVFILFHNICLFLISGLLYGEMVEFLTADAVHELDALHMAIFLKSMSQLPTIQYNNSTNVF